MIFPPSFCTLLLNSNLLHVSFTNPKAISELVTTRFLRSFAVSVLKATQWSIPKNLIWKIPSFSASKHEKFYIYLPTWCVEVWNSCFSEFIDKIKIPRRLLDNYATQGTFQACTFTYKVSDFQTHLKSIFSCTNIRIFITIAGFFLFCSKINGPFSF